jgi:GNAT superfamily N-acetyltransferase
VDSGLWTVLTLRMQIKLIEYGSVDYEEMIRLRITALLEPIGVPPSYIIPENEKADIFIGAFDQDCIIGCCVLTRKNGQVLQLRQMAVLQNFQGKNIGADIIRFAEATALNNGYKILMMHARDPVIGFYEKCGYKIIGDQFFEVGIGHHKMQKELLHLQVS